MSKDSLSDWLLQGIDRNSSEPMFRQLHRLIRQAALDGLLPAGTRLASSRLLAQELGVARNTVIDAYEQLTAEGCVRTVHGSGTYVADLTADTVSASPRRAAVRNEPAPASRQLSARGRELLAAAGVSQRQWGAFMPGVPDVTEFPIRAWMRLQNRHWRRATPERMSYAPGGGLAALRIALAEHLRTVRSVQCEPEQVVVTTGSHQSIDLALRLLTDPGDRVWVEDPCYWGIRSTLLSLGADVHALPVDDEGLAWRRNPSAKAPRMVLVTPSHQYPLGMVMSVARRQALIEQCYAHDAWIIEDDYDSEFRYGTRPLACLQSLDERGCVIYVGSFSKTLFPGLRIGYMVVPPQLAGLFSAGSAALYREGQLQQQAVLADFIEEGHLGSHIRRMRGLYGQRRQCLLEAIRAHFGEALPVQGDNAGLHLILRLPDDTDDVAISAATLAAGVAVRSLSSYYAQPAHAARGLLLGYACVKPEEIAPAFSTVARVLARHGVPEPRKPARRTITSASGL